jgi:outer membrane protein TolC
MMFNRSPSENYTQQRRGILGAKRLKTLEFEALLRFVCTLSSLMPRYISAQLKTQQTRVAVTSILNRRLRWAVASGLGVFTINVALAAVDPVLALPQAIELALKQNKTLQTARLDRVAQRFELKVALEAFTPRVTLNPELFRSQAAAAVGSTPQIDTAVMAATVTQAVPTGAQLSLTAGQSVNRMVGSSTVQDRGWTLALNQPLQKGAGWEVATAPQRLAELTEQTNLWSFKALVTDTVYSVISSYRMYVRAMKSLDITRQSAQRARELLDMNRTLIQNGRMAEVDLIQSEADVANQEFALLAAENEVESSRSALSDLLGLEPSTRYQPDDRLPIVPVQYQLAQALELAYGQRPDFLTAEMAVTQADTYLMLAKDQTRPDLALVATYANNTQGGVSNATDPWRVGLRMSVPLNDLALQKAVVQAEVQRDKAMVRLQEVRNRVENEVRNALRNLEMITRLLDLSQRSLRLSQKKYEVETEKFKAGRSSNFQLLSYKNDLVNAQNNALNTTIAYLDGLSALERTLGVLLDSWQITLAPK